MGRSTPENTQCDTPTMLPNRRGAKRTSLRENVLGKLPCHVHIGSYLLILGHLLLIRSGIRGKLQRRSG